MSTLVLIPARGGSKGIPMKNIKLLGGIPLIHYSINVARSYTSDEHICVSTDSEEIIKCVEEFGLKVPFKRPDEFANDYAGSNEVILHALRHFDSIGVTYRRVLLLQPTSPFRLPKHLQEIDSLYDDTIDMVVSVGLSPYNPYFSLFEENGDGFLQKCKDGNLGRRQDLPPTYYYNGSLYLINSSSLLRTPIHSFQKIKKYLMNEIYCQDLDTPLDWLICEEIINQGLYRYALN